MKGEGVKAGIPDLFLASAGRPEVSGIKPMSWPVKYGLFIEMKSAKGKVTPIQAEIHGLLRQQGYQVSVCYSWVEAAAEIERYLQLERTVYA